MTVARIMSSPALADLQGKLLGIKSECPAARVTLEFGV